MSYQEGTKSKQKSIEVIEFTPAHIDIVNDFAVPIIDGYVIIPVGEGANRLYVKQKVVRRKNTGGTNTIKKPSELHIEIINWFRSQPIRARYSVKFVHFKLNETRSRLNLKRLGFSTVQGRISELQFHRVLEFDAYEYMLDRARADEVLKRGSFIIG